MLTPTLQDQLLQEFVAARATATAPTPTPTTIPLQNQTPVAVLTPEPTATPTDIGLSALIHLDSPEVTGTATETGWRLGLVAVAASADGSTVVLGDSVAETDRVYDGTAFVFTKQEGSWSDTGSEDATVLLPPDHPDWKALEAEDYPDASMSFGSTVAVSGDGGVVVVGAPEHRPPGRNNGAVYVFIRPEGGWDEDPEVITLLPLPGEDSSGFGDSVAVSADGRVVVAGFHTSQHRTSLAYVFIRPTSGWSETPGIARLATIDPIPMYGRGSSVSISADGSTVVFASPQAVPGVAYVFLRSGSEWADTFDAARLLPRDGGQNIRFGHSVSVSFYGDTVLVGAPGLDTFDEDHAAVYVFTKPETGWTDASETAALVASEGFKERAFGASVAVSPGGDRAIVAVPQYLNPLDHVGVYLFAKEGPVWKDMSQAARSWDAAIEEQPVLFGLGTSLAVGGGIIVLGGVAADALVLAPLSRDLWSEWFGADPIPPWSTSRPPERSPELLWRYDASRAVWGTTVSEGRVYVRSKNLDSELFALDAVTGELLWKNRSANYRTYNPYSPPVAAQGMVYVLGRNWTVYSVDGATGTRVLSYGSEENKAVTTPALVDGTLYAFASGGLMVAFEADTGELLWSSQIGDEAVDYSAAIVSDGVLYVALEDGSIGAIDAGTGDVLWRFEVEDVMCHSLVVDEGMVYFAADVSSRGPAPESASDTGSRGRIYAVHASTGELAWVHEASARVGAPSVADGTVYFASGDGHVYALRASNGQHLWDYEMNHEMMFPVLTPPAVADGLVYTSSSSRRVYAIEAATGELVWSYRIGGDVWPSPPAVADGVVYVGSTDGYVYALRSSSGSQGPTTATPTRTPTPTPTPTPTGPEKPTIRLADNQYESLWINNAVFSFIAENGYGYPVESRAMTTPIAQTFLANGEVDIWIELWIANKIDWYNEEIANGNIAYLNNPPIFEGGPQFFMVPKWVAEEHNIRTIDDMKRPEIVALFPDPEDSSKGTFVNCPIDWHCTEINRAKLQAYGLADLYTMQSGVNLAALDAALAGAQLRNEPVFGYYWAPTALMGKYEWYVIEEPAYTTACWEEVIKGRDDASYMPTEACAYEDNPIGKGINSGLRGKAPDIVEMLGKMDMGVEVINKVAAWASDNDIKGDWEKAAIYFLQTYEDKWTSWMPQENVDRVEEALTEMS